jgi:putative FmdB family regulatory protein
MPLYEYKCHGCGKTFEVIQKFADEPLKHHEECGGEVERLISTSALQFKGSGWYVNDYGRGGKLPSGSNGKSENSPSAKSDKSETKSESKTSETKSSESKAESKPAAKESKE